MPTRQVQNIRFPTVSNDLQALGDMDARTVVQQYDHPCLWYSDREKKLAFYQIKLP